MFSFLLYPPVFCIIRYAHIPEEESMRRTLRNLADARKELLEIQPRALMVHTEEHIGGLDVQNTQAHTCLKLVDTLRSDIVHTII